MSLHSLDHEDSVVTDRGYKGYHIDHQGEVTEFYDHRSDEPAPSSIVTARQPLVNGHGPSVQPLQQKQRVRRRDAGCCTSCVNVLEVIGKMPVATGIAFIVCWIGTAMFIGGAWTALDGTQSLYLMYGPLEGNPARDPPPNYIYLPGSAGSFTSEYVLLEKENLGNRVPQVFQAIKYSFYAIIPFMIIFTIILACDNQVTSRAIRSKARSYKTGSTGICMTTSLIICTYLLILTWIFFLCFTTLGVYYYRITMLRCSDLNDRGYTDGVFSSICIDLVQLGLIMFRNTNDKGFGKICGPGDNMRSFGKLDLYCKNYYSVYQCMLVAFAGCLLIILSLLNFIMILTANYNILTRRHYRSRTGNPASTHAASTYAGSRAPTSIPPSVPSRSLANSSPVFRRSSPPPLVVPSQPRDYRARRASKDIELEYMIDDSSSVDRRREMDSHMGVNYYYRH